MLWERRASDACRASWDRLYERRGTVWRGPPEFVALGTEGRVVELGCGDGKTLAGLLGRGQTVVGLDYSTKGIDTCARRVAGNRELDLVVGDALSIPFANDTFGAVVACHILEHLMSEEREKTVAEIWRVTARGGAILVRSFSTSDMRCGKGNEVEAGTFVRGDRIPYHYFDLEELGDLFRAFERESLAEIRTARVFSGQKHHRAIIEGLFKKR